MNLIKKIYLPDFAELKNISVGPRHSAFDSKNNILFITCELSNLLIVFLVNPETCELKLLQKLLTVPD